MRAARASAGLDGAALDLPSEGAISDPVLAGALRVAGELGRLLPVWRRMPLQAVARLHVLAAADLVPAADRDGLLGPSAGRSGRLRPAQPARPDRHAE